MLYLIRHASVLMVGLPLLKTYVNKRTLLEEKIVAHSGLEAATSELQSKTRSQLSYIGKYVEWKLNTVQRYMVSYNFARHCAMYERIIILFKNIYECVLVDVNI